ncbi:nickel pincer cofactor biosynthesis protein LarB [Acidaminobacter sp. JC074]|uniref:nickel pincer cofactor biosynthesis protein LarB n=1 Tax=Acidaminobacter sp. JC074 TaxID=2530199 RepID=UPI001F0EDF94|nr:nickel pincer cofactor biosynthesis protein LarB [Acidaminobacter sp. JC074]MCH4890610.1 nickel pincer cofactor biosynthesis protein LarB [Acidaminobacter sp. JC074]
MYEKKIKEVILDIQSGKLDTEHAVQALKDLPFQDLGYANIDHHREIRTGYPEVIYCEGKSTEHIVGIVKAMLEKDVNILATRVSEEVYEATKDLHDDIIYNKQARILIFRKEAFKVSEHKVLIATGGTSDIAVAEEAALTAEVLGTQVVRLYDVGVAGIHRLLSRREILDDCSVIIAVAGMEGALASVIGGLVDVPVIAVPTSVGYGSHFNGLASLLAMLNSCASGISVVNIDNGFGAGYNASSIIRQIERG